MNITHSQGLFKDNKNHINSNIKNNTKLTPIMTTSNSINQQIMKSLYGSMQYLLKSSSPSNYAYHQFITSHNINPQSKGNNRYRVRNTRKSPQLKVIESPTKNNNNINYNTDTSYNPRIRYSHHHHTSNFSPKASQYLSFNNSTTNDNPNNNNININNNKCTYSQLKSVTRKQLQKTSLPHKYHNLLQKFSGKQYNQMTGQLKNQLSGFIPSNYHNINNITPYHKNKNNRYRQHHRSASNNDNDTNNSFDVNKNSNILVLGNKIRDNDQLNNIKNKQKMIDDIKDTQNDQQDKNIEIFIEQQTKNRKINNNNKRKRNRNSYLQYCSNTVKQSNKNNNLNNTNTNNTDNNDINNTNNTQIKQNNDNKNHEDYGPLTGWNSK